MNEGWILVCMLGLALLLWPILRWVDAPERERKKPREEPVHRWVVFRIAPAGLLDPKFLAIEALTDGPSLRAFALARAKGPVCLADKNRAVRIEVRRRWRMLRREWEAFADGQLVATLHEGKGSETTPAIVKAPPDISIAGEVGRFELELRRAGKIVATLSPDIAPFPDRVGLEVLEKEAPLPILALVVGLIAAARFPTVPARERTPQTAAP